MNHGSRSANEKAFPGSGRADSSKRVRRFESTTFTLAKFQHHPQTAIPRAGIRSECGVCCIVCVKTSNRRPPTKLRAPGVVLVGSFNQVTVGGEPPPGVYPWSRFRDRVVSWIYRQDSAKKETTPRPAWSRAGGRVVLNVSRGRGLTHSESQQV